MLYFDLDTPFSGMEEQRGKWVARYFHEERETLSRGSPQYPLVSPHRNKTIRTGVNKVLLCIGRALDVIYGVENVIYGVMGFSHAPSREEGKGLCNREKKFKFAGGGIYRSRVNVVRGDRPGGGEVENGGVAPTSDIEEEF